ncbi:hypothetical protein Pint_14465 [Pistacia integerrima]|uniref:Uncharacterized protein n=1 Tax=Pistacia integerrima TaxID=434235 RepID=A0ACC0YBW2_9ROSI|nr:hypothetical protein Pint_14465 [Pistacia integerrima]
MVSSHEGNGGDGKKEGIGAATRGMKVERRRAKARDKSDEDNFTCQEEVWLHRWGVKPPSKIQLEQEDWWDNKLHVGIMDTEHN